MIEWLLRLFRRRPEPIRPKRFMVFVQSERGLEVVVDLPMTVCAALAALKGTPPLRFNTDPISAVPGGGIVVALEFE